MCVNYVPIQRKILRDVFGVEPPQREWPPEVWPNYEAPIVLTDTDGKRASALASFGFLPKDRNPLKLDTVNAKSETIAQKRTFAPYWKAGNLCLAPAHGFYEPNYEANARKSTRYRIWVKDEPAFAIAGLWRDWPDGTLSFTMLTVNADGDPLMSRMHAPGKEKRSLVIVPRQEWDEWLRCKDPELARTFMRLYPATLMDAEPAPLPPREPNENAKDSLLGS